MINIDVIYTNEYNAIKLLADDSVRLAIVTRDMYAEEQAPLDAIKIRPRYSPVAYDAIAIILNKDNRETVFTTEQLANILNGTYTRWNQLNPAYSSNTINVVFDSPKSGAVRMLRDSLLKGAEIKDTRSMTTATFCHCLRDKNFAQIAFSMSTIIFSYFY